MPYPILLRIFVPRAEARVWIDNDAPSQTVMRMHPVEGLSPAHWAIITQIGDAIRRP